jgi:hypothetical protein
VREAAVVFEVRNHALVKHNVRIIHDKDYFATLALLIAIIVTTDNAAGNTAVAVACVHTHIGRQGCTPSIRKLAVIAVHQPVSVPGFIDAALYAAEGARVWCGRGRGRRADAIAPLAVRNI